MRKTFIEELKKIEEFTGKSYEKLYNIELKDYLHKSLEGLGGDNRVIQMAMNGTVERVHQAMEAFVHNMNTIHSRGGNQVVFSSINYGTDTSPEGRCVIREILNTTYDGVGNGSTAIFPIQIWKTKRGVSYLPEDPNYDLYCLACKVTARRFFPNFLNLDATFNQSPNWKADDPERYKWEVATMGCRTRVYENRFGESTSIGRGNLSFTTINLPKLAIDSAIDASLLVKDSETDKYVSVFDTYIDTARLKSMKKLALTKFYERLEKALCIAAKQLDERYQFQAMAIAKQFPLLMSGLWNGSDKLEPTERIESVIKNGTLGIGFIGLAEALTALTGKHHGESEASQKEGLKIIGYMKKRTTDFSNIYDHNYSVLATPAEGLSGKFTKKDRAEYGEIKGITDKEYYTNSNHVPVWYKCSAKHKAEVEAPYHALTGGGHIFYVEIDGDATKNIEAVQDIVDLIMENNIGYGSINHNRNRCSDCGYESADDFPKDDNGETYCPKCQSLNVTELQRITGLTQNIG